MKRAAILAFVIGACLGACFSCGLFLALQKKEPCEPCGKTPFTFMRMYGSPYENQWERLNDSYPNIEDDDVFRILIKRGDYFEVVVPLALPITWENGAFVYRGIWPVKNK